MKRDLLLSPLALLKILHFVLSPHPALAQSGAEAGIMPAIAPDDFLAEIRHEFLPLIAGRKFLYEGQVGGATEREEFIVTDEVRTVLGVDCVVVRDRVDRGYG